MSDDEYKELSADGVIPVGSFGFGFGNVSGVDDEGVSSHPIVLLETNNGTGPTLAIDPVDVQPLVTGLMGAALKSFAHFDPKLAARIGPLGDEMFEALTEWGRSPAERERARADKITRRWERAEILYGLVVVVLSLALVPVFGWGWPADILFLYFAVIGCTTIAVRGVFTIRQWRDERRHKAEMAKLTDPPDPA